MTKTSLLYYVQLLCSFVSVCLRFQDKVIAVPVDSWTFDYVTPQFVCLQRDSESVIMFYLFNLWSFALTVFSVD